jgi:hypothetical protein
MSSTYTVKSGDSLGYIFLKAKKDDGELTWKRFKNANSNIKNPDKIKVGDIINIPTSKKHAGSTSAAPKEGKCGNEFTYTPIGRNATTTSVSCAVNGKSSPSLEANKTYINEREKIEESQQGSVDITVDGKKVTAVEELAKYKKHITTHKDVKVAITLIDKELLTPAINPIQIPEFRSPDHQATMTPSEMTQSHMHGQNANSVLELMGLKEENQIVAMEAPSLQGESIAKKKILDIESNEVTWEQKKKIVHDLLSTVRFDGLMLPSALVMGDLLTGTEKAIIVDAIRGLKNRGWNGKFYVNINKAGRMELVFKGWAHFRKYLNFTHILTTDARVSALGAAAEVSKGSVKSLAGAANPFKSAPFGILIVGSMDVVEWATAEDPYNNLSDLFAMLGVDLVKFGLASAGGVAIGAALIFFFPEMLVGVAIISVLAGGVGVSYALERIDTAFGITQSAKDGLNALEKKIEDNYKAPQKYRAGVPIWMMK